MTKPSLLTLALACVALWANAGCGSEPAPLMWSLRFDPPELEQSDGRLAARVLRERCGAEQAIVTQWDLGATGFQDIQLDKGRYGFQAFATDRSCQIYASACNEIELPMARGQGVILDLRAQSPAPLCAPSACVEGRCQGSPGVGGDLPPRVADPLLLYTFREGQGLLLSDVSQITPAANLAITQPNNVAWLAGQGLEWRGDGAARSPAPLPKLQSCCSPASTFSLELWLKPSASFQSDEAVLVAYGAGATNQNFTLSQVGPSATQPATRFQMRLRAGSGTDATGRPVLLSPAVNAAEGLLHLVYVREAGGSEALYIDGRQVVSGARNGDFSTWTASAFLSLGALDTLQLPWRGSLYLLAFYGRALSPAQVDQNFRAGLAPSP